MILEAPRQLPGRCGLGDVPLEEVETTIDRAIAGGMRGRDIEKVMRAMAYGAGNTVDYRRLNQVVEADVQEMTDRPV